MAESNGAGKPAANAALERVVRGAHAGGHTVFLEGPPGAGKRRALVDRLLYLLEAGVPAGEILVLLPDRAAAADFRAGLGRLEESVGGDVALVTYYGLATRLVRRFWGEVAGAAGFGEPDEPPTFLTYETTQHVMRAEVAPLLARGDFEGLALGQRAIVSQLIDNLNKAAVGGFPLAEIEPRLAAAWTGDPERRHLFARAQAAAEAFRATCLRRGLVDLSLAVELLDRHLRPRPEVVSYLDRQVRHLLVDHAEELVPVAGDLVRERLAACASAVLTYETGGGYRVFLGADPEGAAALRDQCVESVGVDAVGVSSLDMVALAGAVGRRFGQPANGASGGAARAAVLDVVRTRDRRAMILAAAGVVTERVAGGTPPEQIAVVAPFVDGVLRFALAEALEAAGVPLTVLRRYEPLREEPAVRAGLALAALAHPGWGVRPHVFDVAEALGRAVTGIDPVRAALLARNLYDPLGPGLRPVDALSMAAHERVGASAVEAAEGLRAWLDGVAEGPPEPLDLFLRKLYGEVVAGPEPDPRAVAAFDRLVASAERFRRAAPAMGLGVGEVGPAYVAMVEDGVVAAQHLPELEPPVARGANGAGVLLAPVSTYLLAGRAVRVQLWLDVGSEGWWRPMHQPLTHPHVLARRWPAGRPWTDEADRAVRNLTLARWVNGLTQRCSEGVIPCASDFETGGMPREGPLLAALERALRAAA